MYWFLKSIPLFLSWRCQKHFRPSLFFVLSFLNIKSQQIYLELYTDWLNCWTHTYFLTRICIRPQQKNCSMPHWMIASPYLWRVAPHGDECLCKGELELPGQARVTHWAVQRQNQVKSEQKINNWTIYRGDISYDRRLTLYSCSMHIQKPCKWT